MLGQPEPATVLCAAGGALPAHRRPGTPRRPGCAHAAPRGRAAGQMRGSPPYVVDQVEGHPLFHVGLRGQPGQGPRLARAHQRRIQRPAHRQQWAWNNTLPWLRGLIVTHSQTTFQHGDAWSGLQSRKSRAARLCVRAGAHAMRSVAPPCACTLTPSSPTACSERLPLSMTSSGEIGCPSLCSAQVEVSTAAGSGRHLQHRDWQAGEPTPDWHAAEPTPDWHAAQALGSLCLLVRAQRRSSCQTRRSF